MAAIGEIIYEDYLYRFTGRSRSILWGKSNPWKQKYFIIKRIGFKPVLEFFNKKPKSKTAAPKGRIELWPTHRVEKITNMKNRAYVFQVTTPLVTVCLSADEQRTMDMFVFFLQIQSRLKDQIREDIFPVNPENSEAQRRIGAKGTNCFLHISPFGVTLALQSNRAVLGQWPLKSIRCYESTEQGLLSMEAGRIAPMGDGLYLFHTEERGDNQIYDLLDQYVLHTLDKAKPNRRGNNEEIDDYVVEAEKLMSLTMVSACTTDNPDIHNIVQNNWNTDIQTQNSARPRQVVHTRLATAGSMASLNSQNSVTGPQSVPARLAMTDSTRNSPKVPRSLPPFPADSPAGGPRRDSNQSQSTLSNRPPLPPPSSSIPFKPTQSHGTSSKSHGTPNKSHGTPSKSHGLSGDQYLQMDCSSVSSQGTPTSQFSPASADWTPPPDFRDVMRQKSRPSISENTPYHSDSYLLPSPGGSSTSTPHTKPGPHNNRVSARNMQYLTPLAVSAEVDRNTENATGVRPPFRKQNTYDGTPSKSELVTDPENDQNMSPGKRFRRLRSNSCEDLSDYLRSVVYDPVSKSMSDLLGVEEEEENSEHEPFPRLQSFSGTIDYNGEHGPDNYYNIEGLKGKIYDGPGLSVLEIRKKFSTRSMSKIRRSLSNPNFIGVLDRDKLHKARVSAGLTASINHHEKTSTIIKNMLPDTLKRHLTKDSSHKGSNGTLSSGANSPHNSSKSSSRANSAHVSPYNTLGRKHRTLSKENIVAKTSVKGINVTKRSRSFRRQKAQNGEPVSENNTHAENQSDDTTKRSNSGHPKDAIPDKMVENGGNSGAVGNSKISSATNLNKEQTPSKQPKIAPKPKPKQSVLVLDKSQKSAVDSTDTTTV